MYRRPAIKQHAGLLIPRLSGMAKNEMAINKNSSMCAMF